ncbi:RNA methyltransferase [Vagococcus sp. CY53-2]|nr:RNA methyltransferase [Vagococcus sp. CY53-2]
MNPELRGMNIDMKRIESLTNQWVKETKKLHKKKYRDITNQYILEGEHSVQEALENNGLIDCVITTDDGLLKYKSILSKVSEEQLVVVTDGILKQLSELPTPQEIIAIMKKSEELTGFGEKILVLDHVQDPGNVGTMIRTADAAGFDQVILSEGCVDVYQSKVQRALQGSQFHVSIVTNVALDKWIVQAKMRHILTVATALDDTAMSFKELKLTESIAIIMGNEGQGVSQEVLSQVDKKVYIPMKGQAESLNVAVAAGIVMFHF